MRPGVGTLQTWLRLTSSSALRPNGKVSLLRSCEKYCELSCGSAADATFRSGRAGLSVPPPPPTVLEMVGACRMCHLVSGPCLHERDRVQDMVVFSSSSCPFCQKALAALRDAGQLRLQLAPCFIELHRATSQESCNLSFLFHILSRRLLPEGRGRFRPKRPRCQMWLHKRPQGRSCLHKMSDAYQLAAARVLETQQLNHIQWLQVFVKQNFIGGLHFFTASN